MERHPTRKAPHPPPEETPEAAGERILRTLLDMPSPEQQTLEEDFLETQARITQREITTLQLATQERKRHIRSLVATQTEKHLREHPSFTQEQRQSRMEAATAFAKKQIDELKANTKELIQAAYVIQNLRNADICLFCRNWEQSHQNPLEERPLRTSSFVPAA